ncbi:hypothetical protein BIW11_12409 [Tropilaelaps mercedesae]|uniref:Uncharacterized protein n=1 Tax=Tropilaelaps mercedesae TaxID=418985 RepID=A0A1V9X6Q7_9ACAR|nr:hypothetical protein BIW11_12409 [Tropilaelaps mercedesae]
MKYLQCSLVWPARSVERLRRTENVNRCKPAEQHPIASASSAMHKAEGEPTSSSRKPTAEREFDRRAKQNIGHVSSIRNNDIFVSYQCRSMFCCGPDCQLQVDETGYKEKGGSNN